jgi:hypothetical protein
MEGRMHHFLAYIDAGTGSMILQVAIAAVIAVPFFLRTQLSRGINFVRARVGRKDAGVLDDAGHR